MNSSTTKKRACLVMLSIVAVLLLAMSTVAPASAARVKVHRTLEAGNLQGVWSSQWGDVTFIGPDDRLTGCWTQTDGWKGFIEEGKFGSISRYLHFSYHSELNGHKGDSGTADLQLQDDNNTLIGEYSRETKAGTKVKGPWTMNRKPQQPKPETLSC